MHDITASISKNLKYLHAAEKAVFFKRKNEAGPQLIRVEYFIDLVARGTVPDSTLSYNVRNYYKLSDDFNEYKYTIESLDEALTVIREFCEVQRLPFTPEDEVRLRKERDTGNGFALMIFEHPIFSNL